MSPHHSRRTTHRWIVDGIEENVARIVEDGRRTIHVPGSLLPDGVREGQVLDVVREAGDRAVVRLEITIDDTATDATRVVAQAADAQTIVLTGRRDEGGDVVL
jgi:hypothetical protein